MGQQTLKQIQEFRWKQLFIAKQSAVGLAGLLMLLMPVSSSSMELRSATRVVTQPRTQTPTQSDTCYLIRSSGQRINLGRLCGDVPPSATDKKAGVRSDGVYRAKIKRRIAATPVIEVTFNGDRSFDMILDTGASGTLITRAMATALRIKPVGVVQAGIADGSVVQLPIGYVRSMSVGGLTSQNLEVAIAKQMDVGLLGHDFFGNYDIKIKRDIVEFYPR